MNESQLQGFDALETNRLNGQRVSRLMHEMYVSATDPQPIVCTLLELVVRILTAAAGFAAALYVMLAD